MQSSAKLVSLREAALKKAAEYVDANPPVDDGYSMDLEDHKVNLCVLSRVAYSV